MLFSLTFLGVVDGCDIPTQVLNGNVTAETLFNYSVVEVTCDDGYELVGADIVYCVNGTEWDAPIGKCQPAQPGRQRLVHEVHSLP